MDQIKKYIVALTNLYGIVPIDKVVEIYNMQNEDQISFARVGSEKLNQLSRSSQKGSDPQRVNTLK